jgi:murein DD-endopeptidase MepM/ murein hydrolase activator NlpD
MPAVAALLAALAWVWPVAGPVVTPFQAPSHAYGEGHRGVDIQAGPGSAVRAAHAGTVSFAGAVAGVATVSIRRGSVTSSYQPVHAIVSPGSHVAPGEVIGHLGRRHGHCSCLHLGIRMDGVYVDPLAFLRARTILKSPRSP